MRKWEPPIQVYMTRLVEDVVEKQDDAIIATIRHEMNIDVDKEELRKALEYDRDQYNKGYDDGVADEKKKHGWIRITDQLPEQKEGEPDNKVIVWTKRGPELAWRLAGTVCFVSRDRVISLEENVEWWMPFPNEGPEDDKA